MVCRKVKNPGKEYQKRRKVVLYNRMVMKYTFNEPNQLSRSNYSLSHGQLQD